MTNLSSFVMPVDRGDVAAIVDILNALPEFRFLASRLSGMPDQSGSCPKGNIGVKLAPIRLSALRTDMQLTVWMDSAAPRRTACGLTPFPQRNNAPLHATAGQGRIDHCAGPDYWR
jgi:hypothetical protein